MASTKDMVDVLTFRASEDVRRRVLADAEVNGSAVDHKLREFERWAQVQFPLHTEKSTDLLSREASMPDPTRFQVVRKAAMLGLASVDQVSWSEFREFCSGAAKPDVIEKVRKALSDPTSNVSQALSNMESWAKRAFGEL